MATLLLIDGSSYLYRAFHAIRDLAAPDGTPTNALYGFVNMLKKLRQQTPADYIACVFDAKGKTFRDDLYSEYKAQRPSMPDELRVQIEPIHAAVKAFGIKILMVDGVEADDVIGTLASWGTEHGITTIMSTGDKDMAQLVNQYVRIENSMTEEVLDIEGVINKFGVRPEQIVDYLALIGDTVDNVPGVPKCGPKTAKKWLDEYQTLDAVMANADAIKGVVGENLRKTLEWLPMAKQLVTIKCDLDLSRELPQQFTDLQPQAEDWETLLGIFRQANFRTWIREAESKVAAGPASDDLFSLVASPAAKPQSITPIMDAPAERPAAPRNYQTILSDAELDRWLEQLMAAPVVSLDTETTGLDALNSQIVGMSFCIEEGHAAYLPLAHRGPDAVDQLPLDATLAKLKPWLESASHKKLGQNLKFDQHIFANHGIALAGVEDDTLLMSYVLASHEKHNMDAQAERELGLTTIKFEELCGKGAKQIGFDEVAVDIASTYAAEDADITLQLAHAMLPRLSGGLAHVYREIEMPSRSVLFEMERTGVLLDSHKLNQQSHEIGLRLLELEQTAYDLAGQPFNLSSPKQIGEIFFEQLKLPVIKKTPKGAPSTDEEVLQELAKDFPLPKVLLEHRSLSKLKSTYTDKLPLMVNPRTGRVHTSYNQTVAVTGRLSSTEPNLQNIPIKSMEGRKIREAFIAPKGWQIMSADYSQIELRIMAHLSGDEAMIAAFNSGEDIHRTTAAEVFAVALDQVSSEQRRYAKSINFGLIYGMGVFGLAAQLEIPRDAAKNFIDRYFARFQGVAMYMENIRASAKEHGYVETVFGRRLWLPEIKSANAARRAGAERAAINAPMQGTAADLIKLAMINVADWIKAEGLQSRLIMQVHDELVLEVPDAEVEMMREQLPLKMAAAAKLTVPLLAEVGAGLNWEEAH
ncbi:DNA polymerase I [Iodobacter fluviatilis]|uniref:DNA polymerase I n=1 Tax=Iodobacter fluviatilis TaxID=537 RepID=A0A377SWK0_9NEIS|nr:DNA polymerase I [Iodobacter fluviatilis]TCU82027.1 DNA polymerase I [Iodobacter fluviatilis]STR44879.1 DNA polymerase I [Iodobacter fluviatilis]